MTAAQWHALLLVAYAVASVATLTTLMFFTDAAYGRHDSVEKAWWWGPGVPTRAAWIVMEAPSSLGFAAIYFIGENALQPVPLLLFAMWQAHYFQRSFVYPWKRRVRRGNTTPLLIPVLAFTTNLGISCLNATILSWPEISAFVPDYTLDWLADPRFIAGATLFAAGYYINRKADAMLAALRRPGERGYKIPRGWLYERISCPNYLGELIVWLGWAVATWSMAGAVFVAWTAANLLPRSLANHRWYQATFPDYPPQRRAVIPGLL